MRDINDLIRRQRYSSGTTLQDDLYALRDASLNVVALTNASGAAQQRMRYAAFGKAEFLTNVWADVANSYDWNVLFHSHYFDAETNFGQMRYRYYHPTLGRFLSRDPIDDSPSRILHENELNSEKLQTTENIYTFVLNNPIKLLGWKRILGFGP